MSLEEKFQQAVKDIWLALDGKPVTKDEQLKLYKLYKRGIDDDFSKVKEPEGFFAFQAKAKYAAWRDALDIPSEDAQKQYVELYDFLFKKYLKTEEDIKAFEERVRKRDEEERKKLEEEKKNIEA